MPSPVNEVSSQLSNLCLNPSTPLSHYDKTVPCSCYTCRNNLSSRFPCLVKWVVDRFYLICLCKCNECRGEPPSECCSSCVTERESVFSSPRFRHGEFPPSSIILPFNQVDE